MKDRVLCGRNKAGWYKCRITLLQYKSATQEKPHAYTAPWPIHSLQLIIAVLQKKPGKSKVVFSPLPVACG